MNFDFVKFVAREALPASSNITRIIVKISHRLHVRTFLIKYIIEQIMYLGYKFDCKAISLTEL